MRVVKTGGDGVGGGGRCEGCEHRAAAPAVQGRGEIVGGRMVLS